MFRNFVWRIASSTHGTENDHFVHFFLFSVLQVRLKGKWTTLSELVSDSRLNLWCLIRIWSARRIGKAPRENNMGLDIFESGEVRGMNVLIKVGSC